jgi:hypothetical protein
MLLSVEVSRTETLLKASRGPHIRVLRTVREDRVELPARGSRSESGCDVLELVAGRANLCQAPTVMKRLSM